MSGGSNRSLIVFLLFNCVTKKIFSVFPIARVQDDHDAIIVGFLFVRYPNGSVNFHLGHNPHIPESLSHTVWALTAVQILLALESSPLLLIYKRKSSFEIWKFRISTLLRLVCVGSLIIASVFIFSGGWQLATLQAVGFLILTILDFVLLYRYIIGRGRGLSCDAHWLPEQEPYFWKDLIRTIFSSSIQKRLPPLGTRWRTLVSRGRRAGKPYKPYKTEYEESGVIAELKTPPDSLGLWVVILDLDTE